MLGPILVHEDQREGSGTNAERIDRDEVACFWDGNMHVVGNVGNDALDDKFGDAQVNVPRQGQIVLSSFVFVQSMLS